MATKPELVNAEKAKESFELIAGFQTLIIIYSGFCEAGKVAYYLRHFIIQAELFITAL